MSSDRKKATIDLTLSSHWTWDIFGPVLASPCDANVSYTETTVQIDAGFCLGHIVSAPLQIRLSRGF